MNGSLPSLHSSRTGTPLTPASGRASAPSLLHTISGTRPGPKALYRRSNNVYGGFYEQMRYPAERLYAPVKKSPMEYTTHLAASGFYRNKSFNTTLQPHEYLNSNHHAVERDSKDWFRKYN
mmetsp:Transcript_48798/g.136588  ORF Transcript_48798/g.136588 Transcript_48798/m.136588 type:complete len:121 (-) Transcript_48798:31-393(-)